MTTKRWQPWRKEGMERKTGARGLRAIMEKTMMDLMYRIPSDDTIRSCTITEDAVEGKLGGRHGEPKPVPRRSQEIEGERLSQLRAGKPDPEL